MKSARPDASDQFSPGRLESLQERLDGLDAPGLVRELTRLPGDEQALAFRLLPKDRALAVFEDLDPSVAAALLGRLRSEAGAALVHDLDPDDPPACSTNSPPPWRRRCWRVSTRTSGG